MDPLQVEVCEKIRIILNSGVNISDLLNGNICKILLK